MNKEIDPNEIPKDYLYCKHTQCPRQSTCLRYQASLHIPQTMPSYTVVNPHHIEGNEINCKYFKTYHTLRFASGIDHLLEKIPHAVAIAIQKNMHSLMGRSMYYRIRNKERLLHPVEQDQIAAIFLKHGIKEKPQFDSYIDKYDW